MTEGYFKPGMLKDDMSCFGQRLSMVTATTDSFTVACHGSTCQDNWSATLECKLPPALW